MIELDIEENLDDDYGTSKSSYESNCIFYQ